MNIGNFVMGCENKLSDYHHVWFIYEQEDMSDLDNMMTKMRMNLSFSIEHFGNFTEHAYEACQKDSC